ncbi:unnamed protein product [Linum trigynum]|uniref:Uncharacterized protein n=1 Tax=Linum trigynum TaxID=586398 RepID=A0AAV2C9Z6_9ROSI
MSYISKSSASSVHSVHHLAKSTCTLNHRQWGFCCLRGGCLLTELAPPEQQHLRSRTSNGGASTRATLFHKLRQESAVTMYLPTAKSSTRSPQFCDRKQ